MSGKYGIVLETDADKDFFTYMNNIRVNYELGLYEGTPEVLHQEIVEVGTLWLEETSL